MLLVGAAWLAATGAPAMQIERHGDQIVLSGPVVAGDLEQIRGALDAAPDVHTVILRNSLGGHAATGYRVGELFRARQLRTAVSGYCISSCSRMFLGGTVRAFTDDYPPERTRVGFHGHYDQAGNLMPDYVRAMGLEAWTLRFSDGKADPALVHRWANIGRASGTASFFPPSVTTSGHPAATFCDAPPGSSGPLACEALAATALQMGITTTDDIVHSNDHPHPPPLPPATGFAALDDAAKLPTDSERIREQYLAFLGASSPRAFALSPDGKHFAWRFGTDDAAERVLERCAMAAQQACRLYAVDDRVVWAAP